MLPKTVEKMIAEMATGQKRSCAGTPLATSAVIRGALSGGYKTTKRRKARRRHTKTGQPPKW